MKKIGIMFVLLFFSFTMVGCEDFEQNNKAGKTDETDTLDDNETLIEPDVDITSDDITVNIWSDLGVTQVDIIDQAILDFQEEYPNITINLSNEYTKMYDRVKQASAANQLPTMAITSLQNIEGFNQINLTEHLNKYILDDYYGVDLENYLSNFMEEAKQVDGNTFLSFPFHKASDVMIVNKTLMEANQQTIKTDSPYTWDELNTVSSSVLGTEDGNCEYLVDYESPRNLFKALEQQMQIEYVDYDGNLMNNPGELQSVLDVVYTNLENKSLVFPIVRQQNNSAEAFLNQKTCMVVTTAYALKYLNPNNQFDVEVVSIPQYSDTDKAYDYTGKNITLFNTATEQEKFAAWVFTKYLTSEDVQVELAVKASALPVIKSAFNNQVFKDFLTNPTNNQLLSSQAMNVMITYIDELSYTKSFYNKSLTTHSSDSAYNFIEGSLEALAYFPKEDVLAGIIEEFDEE